jgi:chemotaxis protein MotB
MAKKKEGHHGGAWKVAYADFVTAMMALFIVLWIIAPEPTDVKVVYDDAVTPEEGPPPDPVQGGQPGEKDTPGSKPDEKKGKSSAKMAKDNLEQVANEILKMLNTPDVQAEPPVDVKVVNETIKVTLYDRRGKPFFETDTSKLTKWGEFVLESIAYVANRHGMSLLLDGHTATSGKKQLYSARGPWELSGERAAAARRRLLRLEMKPEQIIRINGYADTRPLDGYPPTARENQRLTIHMGIK